MKSQLQTALTATGAGIVVLAVIIASYFVARAPDDVIEGNLPAAPTAQPPTDTEVAYTLPEGRSARDIGRDLEALGVISSAERFVLLVQLLGVEERMSAGDYILPVRQPAAAVVEAITVRDRVPVLRVTFPEGLRIEEMAVRAEQAGFGTSEEFIAAAAAASLPEPFAAAHPPGMDLQGYLFPDTYIMPSGTTAADLVARMIETLESRFTPELIAAAATKGLNTHQALTLASIVEREAAVAEERPIIAGVFFNRLEAGDILGADPTVQFVVAQDPESVAEYGWWKPGSEITLEDLAIDSPYNTRLVSGLPPGPITNPGLASIEAVATAPPTDYYYFVADAVKADGSHVFAVTFDEHERNKALVGSP